MRETGHPGSGPPDIAAHVAPTGPLFLLPNSFLKAHTFPHPYHLPPLPTGLDALAKEVGEGSRVDLNWKPQMGSCQEPTAFGERALGGRVGLEAELVSSVFGQWHP